MPPSKFAPHVVSRARLVDEQLERAVECVVRAVAATSALDIGLYTGNAQAHYYTAQRLAFPYLSLSDTAVWPAFFRWHDWLREALRADAGPF